MQRQVVPSNKGTGHNVRHHPWLFRDTYRNAEPHSPNSTGEANGIDISEAPSTVFTRGLCPHDSHVEFELHDVTVVHHVVLAFHAAFWRACSRLSVALFCFSCRCHTGPRIPRFGSAAPTAPRWRHSPQKSCRRPSPSAHRGSRRSAVHRLHHRFTEQALESG